MDATTIAPTPTAPCQPPCGCTPARIATPTRPRSTPTSRQPVERSLGTKNTARSATKMGTDEFATAAVPESTHFSPHAISVNGTAAFSTASTSPGRHARTSAFPPYRLQANATRIGAAHSSRTSMSAAGERSRTPILMNRYDDPQIAPRTTRRKTYRRLTRSSSREARLNHLAQVADQPLHRALGLTDWEADRIRELLGRDPNHFELAVFSLLWSEHCGYKHSAPLLRRLPSAGDRVLQGPGENAGVLDLGDGQAVAFKVESHNHPSAVEPFQGAATGIGGILRDIVAMGARPIALLDGLWFGAPDHDFDRAVAGIGHYGNCVGVPNVGGQTVWDEAYRGNCLVNAMCVGLLDAHRLQTAKAQGPGNVVVLFGATTGRDGIGGASVLASQELGEDDSGKRPSVQVGDPFTGKKLIEVSVELVESGLVESLQDCGAAGLASSLSEMAGEGAGFDAHLDRVPLREEGMEPWEIMISESQERMVAIVRPQMRDAVHALCAKWELECADIGSVSDTGQLRALWGDEVVGDIPATLLTDECPRYEVPQAPGRRERTSWPQPQPDDLSALVYERYDQLV